jgi:hypothetical protein
MLGNVSVTRLYNNSGYRRRCFLRVPCRIYVFAAEIRLVQRGTESRTTETGIGELGRVLENWVDIPR